MSRLIASVPGASFADGSVADVTLWQSAEPVDEAEVFVAIVLVRDAAGRCAVVYSPRRREWGPPGGWREEGETVLECALREVCEETGLDLQAEQLTPFGYERIAPVSLHGLWPEAGGAMQLYSAEVTTAAALFASLDDAVDPQWVSPKEFERLAGRQFWWPLVAAALGQL